MLVCVTCVLVEAGIGAARVLGVVHIAAYLPSVVCWGCMLRLVGNCKHAWDVRTHVCIELVTFDKSTFPASNIVDHGAPDCLFGPPLALLALRSAATQGQLVHVHMW